jgi:hypothetical protein
MMADPITSLILAAVIPAVSVYTAALTRRWTEKRYPPAAVSAVAELDAKLDRTRERIAIAHGKHKDAYKSWKVGDS